MFQNVIFLNTSIRQVDNAKNIVTSNSQSPQKTSTYAVVPWYLKVLQSKISSQTKNYIISMQKFSSIHQFVFEVQPILESHEL